MRGSRETTTFGKVTDLTGRIKSLKENHKCRNTIEPDVGGFHCRAWWDVCGKGTPGETQLQTRKGLEAGNG